MVKLNLDVILLVLFVIIVIVVYVLHINGKLQFGLNKQIEQFRPKISYFQNVSGEDNIMEEESDPDNNPDNNPTNNCPPTQSNWWDTKPVRSIISKHLGVSINVCPKESIDCNTGNINSQYLVIIDSPNPSKPSGALKVNDDGTFGIVIKNSNDNKQLWNIVRIEKKEDLVNLLKTGNNQPVVKEVVNPFFVVVWSESNKSNQIKKVLQYENGVVSVRPLGDYEHQKWDISQNPVSMGLDLLGGRVTSGLSSEGRINGGSSLPNLGSNNTFALQQLTNNQHNNVMSGLQQLFQMLNEQQKTMPPSETIMGNKPLTVKVNLGGNSGKAVEGALTQQAPEGFSDANILDNLENYEKNENRGAQMAELDSLMTRTPTSVQCPTPNLDNYVPVSALAQCNGCAHTD
jgi:hypothetical protein